MNTEMLNTESAAAVACSAWLGHPPRTPMKLVQAGNKLCFGFFIGRISFLLSLLVWACPLVKAGGLVIADGPFKSVNQSARDKVPDFQNLGLQFRNLSVFVAEHEITGDLRLYAVAQDGNKTPEPIAFHGGIARSSEPVADDHNNETADSPSKNGHHQTESSVYFFLSHVLSGMIGALVMAIAWWPNEPSSATRLSEGQK